MSSFLENAMMPESNQSSGQVLMEGYVKMEKPAI
jgi:hypothetical protein